MKAVAYLRVSTLEQSLDRQYEDIKKFASDENLNLVKIFEDKISGSKTRTDDRQGFNEMEAYLELHQDIKNILVLEISRLGRKNNDIQNVVEKYIDKKINIHIRDLNISTLKNGSRSFESEIIISMLGVMAANESRLLSSRIISGKMSRARKNLAFGGKIIGYKKGKDGTPMIDEKEAPMIRRIFDLASQGLGMRNISAMIESEFKKKIPIGTLSGVIRNTFHKGVRKYNDIILDVPEIVTDEIWQKANDSIDSRKKFGSRASVNTNIIHGKITCECGNVMHQKVIPQGRIDMFICKDEKCKNSINRPWLFRMIRKVVEKHAIETKEKDVRKEIELKISSHLAIIGNNNNEIEKSNVARIRARVDHYKDPIGFSTEDFNAVIENYKNTISRLTKENIRLNEEVKEYSIALKSDIEHFSQDIKVFKEQIKDIIRKVVIYKKHITINIFGWREYVLSKPNSIKLGWEARKPENERYLNEELPLRHPIDDEDLDAMINNEINYNEAEIDNHNNSNEYPSLP